ncbi:MAG TPA: glycosyltransferase [Gemmatimonadales bacterium]|nr:glycosyltransferase [Gemmatimonadales bacterium]
MRAIVLSHLYLDPDRRGKLRALAGLGVAVAAAVPGGVAGEDHGVRMVPVASSGDPGEPESIEWSARALRRLITDFRPDLIQVEEEPGTRVSAKAAAEATRLGIPLVLFSQSRGPAPSLGRRRRAARAFRAARAAIGGNPFAVQCLREALPGRPVVLMAQTGVSLPPPVERPRREDLCIGYVGRLLPDRRVDALLRSCAMLMGTWNLTIAGTGPEQEALELLAQRLGLASRVRWLGGVGRAQIEALWPELDCLVLPAGPEAGGSERWSTILIEAMARGVIPVVMEGGIPAAIVGAAGTVTRDNESLGVALQTLLAYPEERPRLTAAARQRVLDHFVDAALADQTLKLWQHILSAPPIP